MRDKAPIQAPSTVESRIIKLPPNYTLGVRCTTFEGMLMYQSKPFVIDGVFYKWAEIETWSLRQLLAAFRNGNVYYGRQKAKPIRRKRHAQQVHSPKHP